MQNITFINILYFYNQLSMQNLNYRSVPVSRQFQPIEIQLENSKDSKEVDFKLFVLLILIVFLGLLINKHQEHLETQSQTGIKTKISQDNQQLIIRNQPQEVSRHMPSEKKENEESLESKKQLYSEDKIQNKTLQQADANLSIQREKTPSYNYSVIGQKVSKTTLETPSVRNQLSQTIKSPQNQPIQNQPGSKTQNQKAKATKHRKQMRKYIEFYFWFPFFIFALIIYTCYEKQHSQSSIFIEVRKSNEILSRSTTVECSICICEMRMEDLLAVLPCSSKHLFHSGCIKQWLAVKKTCPICRCDVREAKRRRG